MNHPHKEYTASVNNIELHYITYENENPKLLLLHGLTGNCFAFNGLIHEGLSEHFSIISIDQRGRGLSSKPAFAYTIDDHAEDVIALLDFLNIDQINICGHSFGGLMASYLAYQYPERFDKVVILDAAPEMNPNAPEMLAPAIGRIDHHYKNFETFLEEVKKAPYLTFWEPTMLPYYKLDVATSEDGSVEPRSNITDVTLIAQSVAMADWKLFYSEMNQKSLLIVALDNYTLDQPLLPTFKAKEALQYMKHPHYLEVDGNHQTMLYGKGAKKITAALIDFIK